MTDLAYASIAELGQSYARKVVSPVEVLEATLDRISRLDARLHTYITVTAEAALLAARESERRFAQNSALGPLDGVPIGLKDLYDTAGVRTTAHSALLVDRIPAADATAVRRLRAAGAVLIGKHALYEFALGRPEENAGPFPPARNPWDPERIPGGSSSGSAAAVAAGLCAGALGSDTGGSIRLPAAYCGVVGLKPTYGLISRAGVLPLAWTLDHAGPITRTVEDAALLLGVVAGHDPADPASAPVEVRDYAAALGARVDGLRVGAPRELVGATAELQVEIRRVYEAAVQELGRLGATVVDVELSEMLEHAWAIFVTIMLSEALSVHARDARERPERYGRPFYARLLEAAQLSSLDYIDALRGRARVCEQMSRVMRSVDVIVLPTTLTTAPRFVDYDDRIAQTVRAYFFTPVFNLTGQPAITVPCGFSADGLPIGLQLAARPFEEHLALAAANAYQRATEWTERRPGLAAQSRSA